MPAGAGEARWDTEFVEGASDDGVVMFVNVKFVKGGSDDGVVSGDGVVSDDGVVLPLSTPVAPLFPVRDPCMYVVVYLCLCLHLRPRCLYVCMYIHVCERERERERECVYLDGDA